MPIKKLTIRNPSRELKFFNKRMLAIFIIIALLVLGLSIRLIYLQVYQKQFYTTLSKENQLSLIPIEPTRGLVYDRNGVLLAENIPVFSLDIIPSKVNNLAKTIKELQKIVSIDQESLDAFYKELHQKRRFEPVPLKIKLTPEDVAKFSVNRWQFPGIMITARMIRYYPLGKAMSHVVGFMGRINAQELAKVDQGNYSATNYIGKVGIEKYYEKQLHGIVGYQQVETDASGRIIRVLQQTPAVAGDNIYLTIDSELEKIAENTLGNENGAVVALDPNTGQVLALVSIPNYDPNAFIQGMSSSTYESLRTSKDRPLYNRALRGLYAPGSIIKPFYGLAGLITETITPDYTIYDPGYFNYAKHTYMNWYRKGFGRVNLEKAIVVSDDTFFYNLAVGLGVRHLDEVLAAFGFGHTSNIEMGEELPGAVPSPKWKQTHIGKPWYTGDTINMGIGQGYLLATPLQIAQATAILAARGKTYQPHLMLKMVTPNQMEVTQEPTPLPKLDVPATDWRFVINAMQEVITKGYGTGFRFGRDAPYSVAAKTGTAQVFSVRSGDHYDEKDLPKKYLDNSLFIAFAPVNKPKIAIAVIAEHSAIAPVVARKMMDYYLLKRNSSNANKSG